ncbi:MAG: hypothetical protein ABIN91_12705 [Mucilaginibacter sp.]|uniref:hypothetical protein n=1 Tax=Mucilaginibacter sp. TaxID=1882438 RepID=UPI003266B002
MQTKTYIINTTAWVYARIAILLAINFIVLCSLKSDGMIYLAGFDLIYLAFSFRVSKIRSVSINDQKLIIARSNFLRSSSKDEYGLSGLDFSYRNNVIGYGRMARKGNVLTVYHNEQSVFDLEPGKKGWSDNSIKDVVADLKGLGLKQTFEKFGSNDIEV